MDIGQLVSALRGGGWRASVREGLHSLLGVYETYRLFSEARDREEAGRKNIFLNVLEQRGMALDCGDLRQRIPCHGPAVVIANHPFGGADAIALAGLCADIRKDSKIMANAMSADLPGTRKWTIPLQIMGEEGATKSNRQAMISALKLLRNGGVLVVFPAGAVSRWRNDLGKVADPEWSHHIVRLVMKSGSPVIPVRFFGRNPCWFELLGAVHPLLRSALIVRVFLTARGKPVHFRGGDIIYPEALKGLTAEAGTAVLRHAVESITEP